MLIEDFCGIFFKAETKVSGAKLVVQEKVTITSGSDTAIQACVRAAPPIQVRLASAGVGSPTFTASCTCPAAGRGQFCKHLWATLLCVERRFPDFLGAKRVIEKTLPPADPSGSALDSIRTSAKLRAADYRKDQYRRQKERAKESKRAQRGRASSIAAFDALPIPVREALDYFSVNGFPMPDGPNGEVLAEARKKLSRVFHPDKGGSHGEMVEFNRYCEILLRFLGG